MEEHKADDLITEDIEEVEDTRPEYQKKRVIVPCITAVVFSFSVYFMPYIPFITNQLTMPLSKVT